MLSSFRILEINYEKLLSHENVTLDREGKYNYLLKDGSSFRWLKIKDNKVFGTLCAGTKKTKSIKQDFSRIDILIGNVESSNLHNKTVEEYKRIVDVTFNYLYEEYGIWADIDNIRFSEMEINCTFPIQYEFRKYHRILKLMMYNLPQSYKKVGQVQGVNKNACRLEAETFYRGNASMEVKIYDKKKQLEQVRHYISEDNIMRIELILKTAQKIREVFGSTHVSLLTDEKMTLFYFQQFERLFEKPYRKWQTENGRNLKELVIQCQSQSRINWKSRLLGECSNKEQNDQIPLLLDINDLLKQIKNLDKSGHYSRVVPGLMEQCKTNDVYLQKDAEKMEEIFNCIHQACGKN